MARRNRGVSSSGIYVIGFVDEEGNLVDQVPDRFKARYAYFDEVTGGTAIDNATVGEIGVWGASLRDVVAWGFSAMEYRKMIEHEERNSVPIASEEELDELFEYRSQPGPRL